MTWLKIPAVTLVAASKVVAVPDVDTSTIAPGDALVVEGVSELLEIEAVFAHQITLVKPWSGESVDLTAYVVPTAADFRKAAEILRKHSQVTSGNLQSLEEYWTKLGTVTFTGRDGTQYQARTLKQLDVDVKDIEERLGAAAEVGAQLVEDYDEQLGESYARVLAAQRAAEAANTKASQHSQTAQAAAITATEKATKTAQDVIATTEHKAAAQESSLSAASSARASASHEQKTTRDAEQTRQDAISTSQDAAQTALDKASTHADVQQTALDKASTSQDRNSAEEAAQTAIEKATQTAQDVISTAADRAATAQDKSVAESAANAANQYKFDSQGFSQDSAASAADSQAWAESARRAANETFVSGGTFTPTAEAEYPDYIGVNRDTSWIVRFDDARDSYQYKAGPLSGKTVWNGDQIFLDVPVNTLVIIPNPSAAGILTVNNLSGSSITLTATHIPYGNSTVAIKLDAMQLSLNGNAASIAANTSSILGHATRLADLEELVTGKLDASATAVNSSKLGNQLPSYYAAASALSELSKTVSGKLDASGTAANSSKFGNQPPSYYAAVTELSNYLRNDMNTTLTDYDGYGNSNLVANHKSGTPAVNGSSYRFEFSVDSPTATMSLEMGNNSKAGVPVGLNTILTVTTSYWKFHVPLKDRHNLEVTGTDFKSDVANAVLFRKSARTVFYVRDTARHYTLDESSFLVGDEVVLYATRVGITHTMTTDEGSFYYPDGTNEPTFTITGPAKVTLLKVDTTNWVVASVST